jgi:hypothetical protein
VEITPAKIVLDGIDAKSQFEAVVKDKEGKRITEGLELVWFTEDTKIAKLGPNGEVTAVSSGEADIEVELVGTELKGKAEVRVKIPSTIKVSHEKLRLWTGQVKENVWSEIHSEKGAFIEGYLPEWSSEDPSIVKVEAIVDPNRRQSFVKMTGMKSGTTHIVTSFQHLMKRIRVAVYDEDEQVSLDGTRIPKEAIEAKEKEKKKAKKRRKKK